MNISEFTKQKQTNGKLNIECKYFCYKDAKNPFCQITSCNNVTKVTVTYQWIMDSNILKCYSYFYQDKHSVIEGYVHSEYVAEIKAGSDEAINFLVLVHPSNNVFHFDHLKADSLYTKQSVYLKYGYTDTRYELLPAPYVTRCDEYKDYAGGVYECNMECKKKWYKDR